MLTTNTIVYPYEQNQNRYENGPDPCEHRQIHVPRNKTVLIGLQFGTCVNVASSEFCGSSSDTNVLSDKKFWAYLRREISLLGLLQ